MYDVAYSTPYEGVISYIGRNEDLPGEYDFEMPGLESQPGTHPIFYVYRAEAFLPEPAVGQELWLSFRGAGAGVLRETQGGPLLLATSWTTGGATELGNLLGIPITVEAVCDYAPSLPLLDTVFATSPPVRVASGTIEPVVIDGRQYRAWAWGQDYHAVTIYPAN